MSTIDHVAFATVDTDKSREIFAILGFHHTLFHKQTIDKFGAYITKLRSDQGQVLELVEPCAGQSVVTKLLQDRMATIYHSAFYTPNILHTLAQLKAAGAVVVTEPMPIPYPATPAHVNYRTSHVYHPHVGLFEITGPLL